MKKQIAKKMEELFCPPEGTPATGGEQMKTGNSYPNADSVDMHKHVSGKKTYALDCKFGEDECKFGVIDLDEMDLEKALEVKSYLQDKGFKTLMSYSGNKGYHVYVLSEPVLVSAMTAALKQVKNKFDFQGEVIPGDAARCKPAPCLHQVSGNMSYLFTDAPYEENFGIENVPEGFWEHQLEILESATVTPANTLIKLAFTSDEGKENNLQDMVPDLSKIEKGLPPCIDRLIKNGGSSEFGTYDKNNLPLASYCVTKGLNRPEAMKLGKSLAEKHSENKPVETNKNYREKVKQFLGALKTPSVQNNPFNCASMLRARPELKFNCDRCKAKPAGINTNSKKTEKDFSFVLEQVIANELITYIIQNGNSPGNIAWEIMPYVDYKGLRFSVFGILIKALNEGVTTEAGLARWLDKEMQSAEDFVNLYFDIESAEKFLKPKKTTVKEQVYELKNGILRYWNAMRENEPVSSDKFQEDLERAQELTMRYYISKEALTLTQKTSDPTTDIFTSSSEFTRDATKILNSSQKGSVQAVSAYALEMVDFLLQDKSVKIETPFPVLNDLLGGGIKNKSMLALASPPGGGKTTLACQIAEHVAENEIPVLLISMEMAREQLFINSLARRGEINSAKIVNPHESEKDEIQNRLGKVTEGYFHGPVAQHLYIVEGDYSTNPGRIESIISMIRAEKGLSKDSPFLVVIDYLQLLHTGNEQLDLNPNETIKISELAVRAKQIARDNDVAVLALSDITKEEQKNTVESKELTLNSLRGSNRIAHAADTVIALYSENAQAEGGKAKSDPWEVYTEKVRNSEKASDFVNSVQEAKENNQIGGPGATAYARIELLKNRSGQGRGNQFLLYHRAFHKFEPVHLEGQEKAEGRG